MNLTMYRASLPVCIHMLKNLSSILNFDPEWCTIN